MTEETTSDIWAKIIHTLEEKLQFGFLEQARAIKSVNINGTELELCVDTDEAFEFLSSDANQQRLILLSQAIIHIENIRVRRENE